MFKTSIDRGSSIDVRFKKNLHGRVEKCQDTHQDPGPNNGPAIFRAIGIVDLEIWR